MDRESFGINEKGHLTIGGADALELAGQYGTPLYVLDENAVRAACRCYRESMERFYDGNGKVLYASKAFCCKEIYRIVHEEGLGADVVSSGELYTALQAGLPAQRIYFHGNNKTSADLRYAIESRVGRIVVDNLSELERLETLLEKLGADQEILLRIKPGIDAHTHDFIRTGQIDSKFGFALETGEAQHAVQKALELERVKLVGLHCHIGSQIFDVEPFGAAAQVMLRFMAKVHQEFGAQLEVLNLGGGFGIRYTQDQDPVPYESYMQTVSATVKEECASLGIPVPHIVLEPGRSIVGDAGATLYTVGAVKEIPKIRTYVSVDGGMADNPRYALYQSEYEAVVAAKADQPKTRKVTIAGCCCESGDLLGEDIFIQECSPGDILAVLCTGAYNYSMASNYNRLPRPAVVMVRDGKPRLIVRRETFEDLTRCDL